MAVNLSRTITWSSLSDMEVIHQSNNYKVCLGEEVFLVLNFGICFIGQKNKIALKKNGQQLVILTHDV